MLCQLLGQDSLTIPRCTLVVFCRRMILRCRLYRETGEGMHCNLSKSTSCNTQHHRRLRSQVVRLGLQAWGFVNHHILLLLHNRSLELSCPLLDLSYLLGTDIVGYLSVEYIVFHVDFDLKLTCIERSLIMPRHVGLSKTVLLALKEMLHVQQYH